MRPLLAKRCYECHGAQAKELKGGLRLDSRELALKGGETGPAVVPGKPKASLLVDAINYGDIVQMPPKSKLPKDEIAILTKWIEKGAPWPDSPPAGSQAATAKFDLKNAKHRIGPGSRFEVLNHRL